MSVLPPSKPSLGFSLVEIMVAMTVLAATALISTTFIFGVKNHSPYRNK